MVYLDAKSDTYLEEVSSCNIFVRKGKTIKTPPLGGTILPGEPVGGCGCRQGRCCLVGPCVCSLRFPEETAYGRQAAL